jgi:hypothetical protein
LQNKGELSSIGMDSAEEHDVYDATSRLVNLGWDKRLLRKEEDSGIFRHTVRAVPSLTGFFLEGLLPAETCKELMLAFESVPGGFSKTNSDVSVEYPPSYRNNSRILCKLPAFTDSVWCAVQGNLHDDEIVGMKPYGWAR